MSDLDWISAIPKNLGAAISRCDIRECERLIAEIKRVLTSLGNEIREVFFTVAQKDCRILRKLMFAYRPICFMSLPFLSR